jgi:hypothetical protein
MDDHEKVEEQVEDLPVDEQSAEDVKGGGGVTAMDDWESPTAAKSASPKLGQRGGWDGNHNEILVRV